MENSPIDFPDQLNIINNFSEEYQNITFENEKKEKKFDVYVFYLVQWVNLTKKLMDEIDEGKNGNKKYSTGISFLKADSYKFSSVQTIAVVYSNGFLKEIINNMNLFCGFKPNSVLLDTIAEAYEDYEARKHSADLSLSAFKKKDKTDKEVIEEVNTLIRSRIDDLIEFIKTKQKNIIYIPQIDDLLDTVRVIISYRQDYFLMNEKYAKENSNIIDTCREIDRIIYEAAALVSEIIMKIIGETVPLPVDINSHKGGDTDTSTIFLIGIIVIVIIIIILLVINFLEAVNDSIGNNDYYGQPYYGQPYYVQPYYG